MTDSISQPYGLVSGNATLPMGDVSKNNDSDEPPSALNTDDADSTSTLPPWMPRPKTSDPTTNPKIPYRHLCGAAILAHRYPDSRALVSEI